VNVRDALAAAVDALQGAGVDTARVDAELLVANALACSRGDVYAEPSRELTQAECDALAALLARRARREPLAYVLGEWGFRRLTLAVRRGVLVPRPETEIVVERCLELLAGLADPRVLDVGTGSGAIALAIADEHPDARVTGLDRSRDALAIAEENRLAAGLDGRVVFVEGDLAAGLGVREFDLVVSNPPYVRAEELAGLQPEIRDWEPPDALVDEGQTEVIARAAQTALRPGGWLVLEAADERAGGVAGFLRRLGYERVSVSPDLTGRDRVVEGRVPAGA
jgi:release factor glutamine methyltransferase